MLESTWVGDWYLVPMCQSTIGLHWPLLVTTETRSTTQPSNTYSRGFIPTNRHQNDKTFSQLLGFSLFDYKNECSFLPADRVTTSPKLCRARPMFHLCTRPWWFDMKLTNLANNCPYSLMGEIWQPITLSFWQYGEFEFKTLLAKRHYLKSNS